MLGEQGSPSLKICGAAIKLFFGNVQLEGSGWNPAGIRTELPDDSSLAVARVHGPSFCRIHTGASESLSRIAKAPAAVYTFG